MENKTILFQSDKIGEGALGNIVSAGFIGTLLQMPQELLPQRIVFLNTGVFLSTQNSHIDNTGVVETLKTLEKMGVEIFSCETCLVHFGLKDKLLVGKIGNAVAIMQNLLSNDGVILF
ncbi:hypothetical protein BKH46_00670 [Helicobacter sp. 12S02634-8]|uniref:DsrE family protein n=1 Tax=Helicobacter sp. 12S02634-8 TaxID=1476199 RepID=UPI000BA62FC2|nr:DsrE family protein [Helicobacter sp. 12S02634-8]PAF48458.1 hypothetical protein BKH46_00670 [Helicobacter sp. 12S02634-8]